MSDNRVCARCGYPFAGKPKMAPTGQMIHAECAKPGEPLLSVEDYVAGKDFLPEAQRYAEIMKR